MFKKKTGHFTWPQAIVFLLIWFFFMSYVLGLWPNNLSKVDYTTLTHKQYGFEVTYPSKWRGETYGEYGYKGAETVKLRIYHSLMSNFEISIDYLEKSSPTLEDVVAWSDELHTRFRRTARSASEYEELAVWKDEIQEYLVIRRQYRSYDRYFEDVYIARANDMIIITLQANATEFDSYVDEFGLVINSFKPME